MRQFMVLLASCAALFVLISQASATDATPQQVKHVCKGKLQSASYADGTKSFGCDIKCSDGNYCTFNCCTGKSCGGDEQQGCHGYVIGRTIGGKVKLPMPAYLRFYAHQDDSFSKYMEQKPKTRAVGRVE